MIGALYLERLNERDMALLAGATGEGGSVGEGVARLRANPERIDALLARPEVFDALFAPWAGSPFLHAGPFLAFSVLLARAAAELEEARFVRDWAGPGRRVPVFDVETLREFVSDSLRRVFLAELLASYTHVVSGSVWVRTGRGWARRRFSELDPVRLAGLLEVVPEPDRLAVYRRLGDLALFLTGVFPDYTGQRLFRPVQAERLGRIVEAAGGDEEDDLEEVGGAIGLLERLGRRSYRIVWQGTWEPRAGPARVLGEMAERFGQARRILNFLTERYLFPSRGEWFAPGL